MKNGKIIFTTYILMVCFIMFVTPITNFLSEIFSLGKVMMFNIVYAVTILIWGIRECWLWHKTDAPVLFKGLTFVGMGCMIIHFFLMVIQETMKTNIDGFKRSEFGMEWLYILSLTFALFYVWKSINKK